MALRVVVVDPVSEHGFEQELEPVVGVGSVARVVDRGSAGGIADGDVNGAVINSRTL
jgi:hypothetical protein